MLDAIRRLRRAFREINQQIGVAMEVVQGSLAPTPAMKQGTRQNKVVMNRSTPEHLFSSSSKFAPIPRQRCQALTTLAS